MINGAVDGVVAAAVEDPSYRLDEAAAAVVDLIRRAARD
jgi:hypothetical protein